MIFRANATNPAVDWNFQLPEKFQKGQNYLILTFWCVPEIIEENAYAKITYPALMSRSYQQLLKIYIVFF